MEIEKMYFIAEFAEMFNISKRTIRRYIKKGVLPERIHPVNNYRFFLKEDIEKFKKYLFEGKK